MKNLTIILILIILVSCNGSKQYKNTTIEVNANLIRTFDSIYANFDSLKLKTYDVKLSIKNKSEKPISFWIMTCSWEDNFIINNDYIQINSVDCNRNFPIITKLNSNDSITYKTTLIKRNGTLGQSVKSTRFGFIFIDSTKCSSDNQYGEIIRDKSKQDRIIWSNPLYLN
ncbi:MAG TPA: hypothetical protein VFK73_08080 [Paludibacter sp.]|nr:hypothetical protein [Paludibacter sp.]